MTLPVKETFENKLAKFWWSECQDKDGNIDLNKVDGSGNFDIIPQNSKGIIQIQVGELRSIISAVRAMDCSDMSNNDYEIKKLFIEY